MVAAELRLRDRVAGLKPGTYISEGKTLANSRELADDFYHYVDAFGERSDGDALVVAVHAF